MRPPEPDPLPLRVDVINGWPLTEIEAGSMETLLSRFSVYENDATSRHWSREPFTTLLAPSTFMSRFIRTDYHVVQIFIPHRQLNSTPVITCYHPFILIVGYHSAFCQV